jgi:hypothetical protein
VIVAQPSDLALLGIRKTLDLLRETRTPVCGLLANMAGYTCPHCHLLSNPFDRGAVKVAEVAQEFRIPYLGQVPFGPAEQRAPAVAEAVDYLLRHRPATLPQDSGGFTRWLMGLSTTVTSLLECRSCGEPTNGDNPRRWPKFLAPSRTKTPMGNCSTKNQVMLPGGITGSG